MIKNFNQFNESSESKGSELFLTLEEFDANIKLEEASNPGIIDDIVKKVKSVKNKIVKSITPDKEVKKSVVEKKPKTATETKEKGGLIEYLEAIAFKECSGDPTKINTAGYMGKYQFSDASLNDVLKVKSGESFESYKKRISKFMPNKFGKIENFYNGSKRNNKSLSSKDVNFFRSKFRSKGLTFWPEKKQDQAMIQLLKNNFDYLGEFTSKYKDQFKKGIKLTISGMLAGAHLLGPKAVKDFIRFGTIKKDGYGTPITEYLKKFGGFKFFLP